MNEVILVDDNDNAIGTAEKLMAHQQGLLHRAFSAFVLRKNSAGEIETLLQQRDERKYHGGGLWSNTCCSHPEPGETVVQAAERRLQEELGFTLSLQEIAVFTYRAEFPNGLIEHEFDHVLIGEFNNQSIMPNSTEVMDYRWLTLAAARQEYEQRSHNFTPWFAHALTLVQQNYS